MLLIDLSYFIFYRYYATYSWYRKSGQEAQPPPMQSAVFLSKYDQMFEASVTELRSRFNIPWSRIIFAKDCCREDIWRREHYAAYKHGRDERLDSFDKEIFKHTITSVIPGMQSKHGGCHVISIAHMEADDLVACVKRHIREETPEQEIVIITNDNDYVQLIDDFTLVVNLQGCDLKNRVLCDPAEYLEQKIIMGDKSDNIPSIARKIGEKTSAKLAIDREALESLFVRVPSAKAQYELNKLLISFESIPDDLREQAVKAYKDLLI